MTDSVPTLLDPLWFIPLFVVSWFSICAILAHVSSWPLLASRFRSNYPIEGEHFRFASGCIGPSTRLPVSYRNCLFFTVGKTGFLMSLIFPFRFRCPPLFIPWAEVESITEERYWFVLCAVIHLRGFSTRIMVPRKPGKSITQAYVHFSTQQVQSREAPSR
jgi:hypothetical protein